MFRSSSHSWGRMVAGGAAVATALAGFSVVLASPASAVPVGVTGTLTDAAGNALDGRVSATPIGADGSIAGPPVSAIVADGIVSINVEPGAYKFYFADQDGLTVPEYYNDKATFATADVVPVGGPTVLAPVSLAARATLSGQVVSPTGRPIEDASVYIYDAAQTSDLAFRNLVTTKADGTWVAGVDPGSYKVRFSGGGYASEYYSNKPSLATADVVGAGASLGVVTLSEGSVVQGGIVSDAGVPLERARATVMTASGSTIGSDLTDANGYYRIEGVAAGTYRVQFTDPVGEYLSEYNDNKATLDTADPVEVGLDTVVSVNANLTPDPDAAIDPATVGLSGVVTDSAGAPVIGADVYAWDTPADGDKPEVFSRVSTNRAGAYYFTSLSQTSEAEFKIEAADNLEREEGQYYRLKRWYGGAQTYAVAAVATKPAGGVNITLPLTGGISGVVTSESGLDVRGTLVDLFDEKGNPDRVAAAVVEGEDGAYLDTNIVPGTYKVRFTDSSAFGGFGDFGGGDIPRVHAPEWYDDTSFLKAKTITIKSGETLGGINAALSEELKTYRKPEIKGKPYLGGKVRAYQGVWSVETGTSYNYAWLIGDTVVGTGPTYKITKAAKNKRVTLRVIAENGSLSGTALVTSQVIKKKPKVKIAVKGNRATVNVSAKKVKPKKFKGNVVVKKIVREDVYGAPVYKTIGKGKLRNGVARLTLKKLVKGKNKVVFEITLKGGKYGNATVSRTLKVKRA